MVIKLVIFGAFLVLVSSNFLYFLGGRRGGGVGVNKTIIPFALVGYEIGLVIANLALRASLAIYHLISNACSWNN